MRGELMNEKKSVFKAGIGYTIGNYLVKGINFLTIPIFARMLSVSEYGLYNIYVSYESVLFVFMGLGISYSVKSAKLKYKSKVENYISSCILLLLLNYIVVFVVLNISYPLYNGIFNFSILILNILIIHSLGSAMMMLYNSYVSLEYKYKEYVMLALFNAILSVFISIILIALQKTGQKYIGRIVGASLPITIICIYVVFYFFKKKRPAISLNYWSYALKYGLPMIPHGLSVVILSQFDRIMISSMVGTSEAGVYSFAYNLYMIISITATSLDNAWGPWFFKKMDNKEYTVIRKGASLYAFGMMVFTVVLMFLAPEIILALGGSQYKDSIYCVLPVIGGGYFAYLYTLPVQIEYYKENTKMVALASGLAATINVFLNYIFIRKYGYIAAAYTTFVTYILYFLFHWFVTRNMLYKEEKDIFSKKIMIFVSGSVVIGCFLALFLVEFTLIRWGIACVILLGCCIKFKVFKMIQKRCIK